jgi:hypothetical protein
MKKLILLFAVWVWGCDAQAQPTFEKYYLTGGTATLTLSEQSSGNLFTGIGYSGISIIDPQGNIFYSHSFEGLPLTVVQTVRKHTDNEIFFAAGYLVDTCTTGQNIGVDPVIGKMDSLGDILAVHRYQLNAVTCSNTAQDLVITNDGGAIAWGRAESFFALKVDPAGLPLWSKQFPHHGSFGFIRELSNGDFLAGINMDTAGVVVARMDADGNFIWCKSYIRPRGVVQDCVIESDNSFIIIGYTDSIASTNVFDPMPSDYQPKLFMMKLDGMGEVQWCKGYRSEPRRWYVRFGLRIERTLDGNYVVLANTGGEVYNSSYRPFLMKTDLNGDTLWTRSAGVYGYSYASVNLMASSDGGIYFDGGAYGSFGQSSSAAFLFKTDSSGHLPCSEQPPPPLTVSDLFPSDSSFTLTSVDGATAYPAFMQDTTYAAITVYDGCTDITAVAEHAQARKTRVYPNPSTGRVTVEFTDPLTVDNFYSVYDATGKLLFQRPFAQSAEKVEIDLSRYGKGLYLIRFSDRDGVCSERVVVE